MSIKTRPVLLASACALVLAGCADPYGYGGAIGSPDYERTRQGAAVGAAIGTIAGARRGDDTNDRVQNAAVGGLLGAAVGGGVGALLDRQARELRNDFDNSQIDVVNTGEQLIVRMPQDILFAVNSTAVRADLQSDLRVMAANLQRYPNSRVTVIGHTDSDGSAAYNQDLSERRALAVTSILQANGVSGSRLQAVGRGEDQPIASNATAAGKAQNRRVEIVVTPY
ncbi:OmpA family protein [Roseitranquillus sediminis]|uniref:OmpA family protein n=1 Tax=Roseitranquillus sediminis TaxID=2809051 RepID=UPI001D0C7AAE|nr:OmpA family protein [Roseitranquillus sediminis]MBM9593629.1 OmpA family protein [Roseitranquillus sediminis]